MLCPLSPILTGKPGGSRRVMKSRSLAKWAFEMAMRSMMGVTCSASDRGCVSLSQSVALNLANRRKTEKGRCCDVKHDADLKPLCHYRTSAPCWWARRGVRCPGRSGWTRGWSIPRQWWQWGCEDWHTGTYCSERDKAAVSVCERMNEPVSK